MIGQRGPRDGDEFVHGTARMRPTNQTRPPLHRAVPKEAPTMGGAVRSLRTDAPAGEGTLRQQSLARKTKSTRVD